jgi:uncharacterized protein YciI
MQQYVVHAWDGTDDQALERRMKARPAHFDNSRRIKASGNFILGGAMLNDEGKMIGSTMVLQFETKEELQQWVDSEPYITGNVWQKIDIRPFRVADV